MPMQRKRAEYNELGEEIPDPEPVEIPLEFRPTPEDILHRQIREYMLTQAFASKLPDEVESPHEADDFYLDDEGDLPLSSAERAYMMAEELKAQDGDLREMEGRLPEDIGAEIRANGERASKSVERAGLDDQRLREAGESRGDGVGEGRVGAGERDDKRVTRED